jgi:hypothetical protein
MVLPVSVHVQGVFSGGACVRSARYVRVLVVDTHTHTHTAGCVYTGSTNKCMYVCKVIALRAAAVLVVSTQDRQTNLCMRAR